MYREVDAHLSLCLLLFTSFDHTDGIKFFVQLDSRWTDNGLKCDPLFYFIYIYPAYDASLSVSLRFYSVRSQFLTFTHKHAAIVLCSIHTFVCLTVEASYPLPLTFGLEYIHIYSSHSCWKRTACCRIQYQCMCLQLRMFLFRFCCSNLALIQHNAKKIIYFKHTFFFGINFLLLLFCKIQHLFEHAHCFLYGNFFFVHLNLMLNNMQLHQSSD